MIRPILTRDRARELLVYDLETGVFRWRVGRKKARAGAVCGCDNGRGYLRICVDGQHYLASRLAWFYVYGVWPTNEIDHINGAHKDNRIANLRDVSRVVNQQNQRAARVCSKTGFLGVSPNGKRFMARIVADGIVKHIGTFDTPEIAHAAYLAAKQDLHAGCTLTGESLPEPRRDSPL